MNDARFYTFAAALPSVMGEKPTSWFVMDREGGGEIASCQGENPDQDADRIAFAMNTLGRLLGPQETGLEVEAVARMAVWLDRAFLRALQRAEAAKDQGDMPRTENEFRIEAEGFRRAAGVVRWLAAELLKFRMIEDAEVEARSAAPQPSNLRRETVEALLGSAKVVDAAAEVLADRTRPRWRGMGEAQREGFRRTARELLAGAVA
jgi:hypothetical protein